VQGGRCIGLFGMMDVQGPDGQPIAPYNGGHPAMNELQAAFKRNGLFTFSRWSHFMCNPPLSITEAELREGFAIIDRSLSESTDRLF
jgi:taurine--2-oxoglutarate transaminase